VILRAVGRWQWRTGAVLAGVGGCGGALAQLSLRAGSQGQVSATATLLGGLLLSMTLWPLAARTTRVLPLGLVLAAAQFGSHALTVLGTGQPSGPAALVCCPSAAQTRRGPIGALTAQAGWALAAAQLLVCLLLAIGLRAGRTGLDLLGHALALIGASLGASARRVCVALRLLTAVIQPAAQVRSPRPGSHTGRIRTRIRVVATVARRGPPARIAFAVRAAG
jgi:hypothetical protein